MTTETERDTERADTQRTVTHGTFTLERTYPHSPQTVFDAWASRDAKNAWFGEGDDFLQSVEEYRLDFRVGGEERLAGSLGQSGNRFEYNSVYADIVDGRRIVAMYDVLINGRRISASLLTVELHTAGSGTLLIMTEQGAFFDGLDTNEQRVEGAGDSLDSLERYLGD